MVSEGNSTLSCFEKIKQETFANLHQKICPKEEKVEKKKSRCQMASELNWESKSLGTCPLCEEW